MSWLLRAHQNDEERSVTCQYSHIVSDYIHMKLLNFSNLCEMHEYYVKPQKIQSNRQKIVKKALFLKLLLGKEEGESDVLNSAN